MFDHVSSHLMNLHDHVGLRATSEAAPRTSIPQKSEPGISGIGEETKYGTRAFSHVISNLIAVDILRPAFTSEQVLEMDLEQGDMASSAGHEDLAGKPMASTMQFAAEAASLKKRRRT